MGKFTFAAELGSWLSDGHPNLLTRRELVFRSMIK